MTRVQTKDATAALTAILTENAKAAAGSNSLLSKTEEKALDPVLQKAARAIRSQGGAGTRVSVDAVVSGATSDSVATWGQFNANNTGRDGAYLSNDEAKAIAKADPALGALTELALLRVRRGAAPSPPPTPPAGAITPQRAAAFIAAFDFTTSFDLPNSARLDVRAWQPTTAATRAQVPPALLAAFDHYARAAQADWASVKLLKGDIDGKPVYSVSMSTDGDDKYVEIYDNRGNGLASARAFTDGTIFPDPFFGRARLSAALRDLDGAAKEDGLSEPLDRARAGQPPKRWRGDARIEKGEVHFDQYKRLVRYDLPNDLVLTAPQRELAFAALDLVAERVLRHSAVPGQPAELGPQRRGTLSIGSFTRGTDGQTYETAAWDDIDDGSYVFYFQRDQQGNLRLKHDQFDN